MKKSHIAKKKLFKFVGTERCCCDGKHHIVNSVDEHGMAQMIDGKQFDIFYCSEPVQADNSCHTFMEEE